MERDNGLTLAPRGGYIGHGDYGPAPLYSLSGVEIVRDGFVCGDPGATRRAVRAVRRWHGGPMRILCEVYTEQGDLRGEDSEPMHFDSCEVYGWRAALTAIRAMRREMPYGWRLLRLTSDARLDALFAELRGQS